MILNSVLVLDCIIWDILLKKYSHYIYSYVPVHYFNKKVALNHNGFKQEMHVVPFIFPVRRWYSCPLKTKSCTERAQKSGVALTIVFNAEVHKTLQANLQVCL